MKELTETQRAYIAGLFDGEGCLHFSYRAVTRGSKPRCVLWMEINNTNPDISFYLQGLLDGFTYNVDQGHNKKRKFGWRITYLGVYRVLKSILPYLRIKHDQAQLILDNESLISHRQNGKQRTPEEKGQLISLMAKSKAFNKRGLA